MGRPERDGVLTLPGRHILTLQPSLSESMRVRAFLGKLAHRLGFSPERSFDIQVAVGEAVANAIEHAHGTGEVRVETKVLSDRLEVSVQGPGEFHLPAQDDGRRHRGLGLPLMAKLSDHLALYSVGEGGTLVTLTFYLPGATRRASTLPPALTELIAENTFLNDLFNNLPDGFMVCDLNWRYLYVNERLAERAGMAREEMLGRNLWELFPINDPSAREAMEVAKNAGCTARIIAHDADNDMWRELSVFPVSEGIAVVSRDIGDQKRAEGALRESEERFRATFEQAAVGIAHVALDGRFLRVNQRYAEILGYDPGDLCRLTIQQISQPDDLVEDLANMARLMRGEVSSYSMDKRYFREDGSVTRARLTVSMVGDPASEKAYFVSVIEDISALEQTQRELHSAHDQLETVLDAVSDGFAAFDAEFRFRYIGRILAEQIRSAGIDPGALIGKALGDVVPTILGRKVEEKLRAAMSERRAIVEEMEWRGLWYEVRAYPLADGGLAVLFPEITERKLLDRGREAHLAELAESARLGEALLRVNEAVSSALDSETILQVALEEFAVGLGAETGAIGMRENGLWVARYAYGFEENIIGHVFRDEQAQFVVAAEKSKAPVVIQDVEEDDRVTPEVMHRYGVKSAIVVPLLVRDQVIGVLLANHNTTPAPFSVAQVDFGRRAAASISLALETAQLHAALTEDDRLAKALVGLTQAIAAGTDQDEILHRVVVDSLAAVRADSSGICLRDDGGWTIAYGAGIALRYLGRKVYFGPMALSVLEEGLGRTWRVDDPIVAALVPEEMLKQGAKSFVAIPLMSRGEIVGILFFSRHSEPADFSPAQLDFAENLATSVSLALENARLYGAQKSIADTLQEALMRRPKDVPGLEIDSLYRSATEAALVGGDFFDVFEIDQELVGLVIGDVCGHGVEAARLALFVRDALRAYAFQGLPVARVMGLCNWALVQETGLSGFTTVFLATLNREAGELSYCSAGHPPALVRRGQAGVEQLADGSGLPLGAFPSTEYVAGQSRLSPSDLLLLYTDGVAEARSAGSLFGEERVADFLRSRGGGVRGLARDLLSSVLTFSEGRLLDDLAVVAVKRRDPA